MKKILFCMTMFFTFFPFHVFAECSSLDRERLQKMANNISITLDEKDIEGVIYFEATVAGVSKEIKLYEQSTFVYYRNITGNSISEIVISNLRQGKIYTYKVVGDNTCKDYNFRTIKLNIPKYNHYYDDPICDDAGAYNLCQKWYDTSNLSYEEFATKVKTYVENNNVGNFKPNDSRQDDKFYSLLEVFSGKYYYIVLFSLIICLLVLICLWIRTNKKNRL